MKSCIIAIDYFTKWVEAKALTTSNQTDVESFIWKQIICRFGVPRHIVTDHGKQFQGNQITTFFERLGIHHHTASVSYPQANGQVEDMNLSILYGIRTKLEGAKGSWAEDLPRILWGIRTTSHSATRDTLFSLFYGTEVVLHIEIGLSIWRMPAYDPTVNDQGPYIVKEKYGPNTYVLSEPDGKPVERTWNTIHLREYCV
ncbi:hypothetical protein LIER_22549 [Lithospermum erythrorhizon]|uniref:Integrase catalytic domain-containing protein n=1 Tax=Lithospermum erythrorhizon TaxID=34254 RepID=A0AAV3QUI2_LITER